MNYGPGNPEFVDGRSVLCHDDVAQTSGATLSASSTAAASGTTTYDAANAFDGLTYDYWQAAAGGAQWLKIALPVSAPVDYMCLAAHDLGTKAASVQLQGSLDDATYVNLLPEGTFTPANDRPIVKLFNKAAYRYFKLTVTPASGTAKIGVWMMGASTPLQRGVRVGHQPATFARKVDFTANRSESGNFVGRSVLRVANDVDIDLSKLTDRWYREHFEPFAIKAETRPWAFVWDRWRRPDEAFFGYALERPIPTNDKTLFMSVRWPARGLA